MKVDTNVKITLVVLISLILASCDSSGGNKIGDVPVEGNWEEVTADSPIVLKITSDYFYRYNFSQVSGCWQSFNFEIIKRDGKEYTLRGEDGDTNTVVMYIEEEQLTLKDDGRTRVFSRSDMSISESGKCE